MDFLCYLSKVLIVMWDSTGDFGFERIMLIFTNITDIGGLPCDNIT